MPMSIIHAEQSRQRGRGRPVSRPAVSLHRTTGGGENVLLSASLGHWGGSLSTTHLHHWYLFHISSSLGPCPPCGGTGRNSGGWLVVGGNGGGGVALVLLK